MDDIQIFMNGFWDSMFASSTGTDSSGKNVVLATLPFIVLLSFTLFILLLH